MIRVTDQLKSEYATHFLDKLSTQSYVQIVLKVMALESKTNLNIVAIFLVEYQNIFVLSIEIDRVEEIVRTTIDIDSIGFNFLLAISLLKLDLQPSLKSKLRNLNLEFAHE